ncbi:MAG: HEAT repeat domain-containing protein [Myxococcota bacterium]
MKWGLMIAVLTLPTAAQAQLRLSDAETMLAGESADEVMFAIESMAELGNAAIRPLKARIESGLPPDHLQAAIRTLVQLEARREGALFTALARHRNEGVRAAALDALAALRIRGAGETLSAALGDGSPIVRATAALGLGALGDRNHMDRLFTALDRNVLEAAQAIGQIAEGDDIDRLLGYLGRISFDSLTPAFQELFARSNVNERTKFRLVGQLAELSTPGVRAYLLELADFTNEEAVADAARSAAMRIAE